MIKVVCKYIPNPIRAIAIWPFVFFRTEALSEEAVLINHEKIHLEQQKETLLVPFFVIYVIQGMVNFIKGDNPYLAYRNTSAEKEAWDNEDSGNYLSIRKRYKWLLK